MVNPIFYANRESWLEGAVVELRPWFADIGAKIPDQVRVACGWSKRSGKGAIGWCWHTEASDDQSNEIQISPELADPIRVLATLAHELIHASDNGESKHTGYFRKTALALGLKGPMTATTAGDDLIVRLRDLHVKLGNYPHAALKPQLQMGKQSTRMLKGFCDDDGYTIRLSRKWADAGLPECPVCGNTLELIE